MRAHARGRSPRSGSPSDKATWPGWQPTLEARLLPLLAPMLAGRGGERGPAPACDELPSPQEPTLGLPLPGPQPRPRPLGRPHSHKQPGAAWGVQGSGVRALPMAAYLNGA